MPVFLTDGQFPSINHSGVENEVVLDSFPIELNIVSVQNIRIVSESFLFVFFTCLYTSALLWVTHLPALCLRQGCHGDQTGHRTRAAANFSF